MKRTLAWLSAAVLGTISAVALVGTAHAEDLPDCKTGTVHTITNRVDSAAAGDYNWALDTFDRKFKVCHVVETLKKDVIVPGWTYSVELWDAGTFVTTGTKSPQHAATMLEGIKGDFGGAIGKDNQSVSGFFAAPANWQGWTAPTTTNKLSTSEWIQALFLNGDTSTVSGLKFTWAWLYKLCNEAWLNADEQHGGNKGDITGLSRLGCPAPPVFTDKCDGSTVVVLANVAPNSLALPVKYNVNGDVVSVSAGQNVSKTVTVDGEFTVIYFVGRQKVVVKHTWAAPKNCTSPSPSTSAPSTSTSTSQPGLPVTGANTTGVAIAGGALLLLGGALVVILRRRRVRFEA